MTPPDDMTPPPTPDPEPFIRDAHEHCSDVMPTPDAELARWHAAELLYLGAAAAAGATEEDAREAWAAGLSDYRRKWLKPDGPRPQLVRWTPPPPPRPAPPPRPRRPAATEPTPGLTLKVTPAVLRRLDALLPWAEGQIDIVASGRASRTDVTRAALAIGIVALEKRAKGGA